MLLPSQRPIPLFLSRLIRPPSFKPKQHYNPLLSFHAFPDMTPMDSVG